MQQDHIYKTLKGNDMDIFLDTTLLQLDHLWNCQSGRVALEYRIDRQGDNTLCVVFSTKLGSIPSYEEKRSVYLHAQPIPLGTTKVKRKSQN